MAMYVIAEVGGAPGSQIDCQARSRPCARELQHESSGPGFLAIPAAALVAAVAFWFVRLIHPGRLESLVNRYAGNPELADYLGKPQWTQLRAKGLFALPSQPTM
jgi:hypothetical protein